MASLKPIQSVLAFLTILPVGKPVAGQAELDVEAQAGHGRGAGAGDHDADVLDLFACHFQRVHERASHAAPCRCLQHADHEGREGQDRIGSVGDAYDNALMETVNGLYKTECIRTTVFHSGPYRTIGDVEYATAGWVDWYNNRRLHSSLGNVPPVEHEHAHYAALSPEPQPT